MQSRTNEISARSCQAAGVPAGKVAIRDLPGWTLALSLGKECGYATGYHSAMFLGSSPLRDRRFRGGSASEKLTHTLEHWGMFAQRIVIVRPTHKPRPPKRTKQPRDAVWQALADLTMDWAQNRKILVETLKVGDVKKNFTGNGNASEDVMFAEAQRRSFDVWSFDQVLALATFDLGYYRGCEPIHA